MFWLDKPLKWCSLVSVSRLPVPALCHAEVCVKRHASMYEAAREVLGVRPALLVGWAVAAWRVAALAACARSLGATIDYISGGHFRALTTRAMLRVFPLLEGITPDPLAAGACCLTTLLFVLGLEVCPNFYFPLENLRCKIKLNSRGKLTWGWVILDNEYILSSKSLLFEKGK